ncbi:MAG: Cys-tRNA(Pro) deacylase [Clostridia bacterium]|nr:Cys-tRNA(Pro) deacylase [Clostridia bacterium]
MTKTNTMRMLDRAKISYEVLSYEYDESDLSGVHAAQALSLDPAQVFKTLVTRGGKGGVFVFCIPVDAELDLKKAARCAGVKNIEMLHVRELQGLTGYIRGGCSPVGMKKQYPTFIDASADMFGEIYVSAGLRGQQLKVNPRELKEFIGAQFAEVTVL